MVRATGRRSGSRGALPHGTMHSAPLSQMPAQRPAVNGAQADPAGNPCATQSASRSQTAQPLQVVHPRGKKKFAQKLVPAVVRT